MDSCDIAPKNRWLEDEFSFGMAYFQGQTLSFRECSFRIFREGNSGHQLLERSATVMMREF